MYIEFTKQDLGCKETTETLNRDMAVCLENMQPVEYTITVTAILSGSRRTFSASMVPPTKVVAMTNSSTSTTTPSSVHASTKGINLGLVMGVVGLMVLSTVLVITYKRVTSKAGVLRENETSIYRGYRGTSYIQTLRSERGRTNMFV